MNKNSKYKGYKKRNSLKSKKIFNITKKKYIKRRIRLSIFVIIILSIGILAFKNTSNELLLLETSFDLLTGNRKGTTVEEGSGITVEENEYFKKYTIYFDKNVKSLSSKQEDSFNVTLGQAQLKNLNLKDGKLYNYDELNIENKDSKTEISLNTKFKNNNYVFEDEVDKNKIEILISSKKSPYDHKVTIDPGHGGDDPGVNPSEVTINNGVKDEKVYTLEISLNTEKYLRYNGIDVNYTRTDDVVPGVTDESADLARRAKSANNFKSDVFVSVHIDSYNADTSVSGITLMLDPRDTGFKEESNKLAEALKRNVLKDDSWEEREIREEDLQALNESNMPAVLIECGFLTNLEDVQKLNKPQVIDNLSKNISNGIIQYLNDKNKYESK